jgi:hypothetical protein
MEKLNDENAGGGLGYEDSHENERERRKSVVQAEITNIENEANAINNDHYLNDVQKLNKREQANVDFQNKWAGALLLGPFVPAIISLIVIFSGQIVLNAMLREGTRFLCEYPLDTFISVQIAMCYLFLVIYSWVYLGDDLYLKISYLEIDWHVLTPFRDLKSLYFWYIFLAVINTIVAIAGTILLGMLTLLLMPLAGLYIYLYIFIYILTSRILWVHILEGSFV